MAGYNHYAGTAGVVVQKGTTLLKKVVVNTTGTSWVITIYDGVDNTGNVVAVLNAQDGGNYDYECTLVKGLYVAATGTPGDATIVYG